MAEHILDRCQVLGFFQYSSGKPVTEPMRRWTRFDFGPICKLYEYLFDALPSKAKHVSAGSPVVSGKDRILRDGTRPGAIVPLVQVRLNRVPSMFVKIDDSFFITFADYSG